MKVFFKIAIISCVFICACSVPNYFIGNAAIFDRSGDKEVRMILTEVMDYTLSKLNGWEYVDGYKIIFDTIPLTIDIGNGYVVVADGSTLVSQKAMYIQVHSCIWDTSLPHELGHAILFGRDGDGDHDHDNDIFWAKVKGIEERFLKNCPKGYRRVIGKGE